jgi:hypothetical protein
MTMRFAIVAGLLIGALTSPAAAADGPSESIAETLFRQARDEMRRGNFARAYPELVESQLAGPSNGTLLNLMICEEQIGKLASAWIHGRQLLERLDASDERKTIAARHVEALSRRVPTLTVHLTAAAPADARVYLDGVQLGPSSLGTAMPVDPGIHRMVVSAPGREDHAESIVVAEAGVYDRLAEPSGAPPVTEEPPVASTTASFGLRTGSPDSTTHRAIAWPALATGITGFVVGGALALLALERAHEVGSDCPAKQCRDSSGFQAAEEGRWFTAGAVVAFSAGIAGTGLSVYFLRREQPAITSGSPRLSARPEAMVHWSRSF